ncbi:SgcJ/EcaC family oxidoreductase [Mucilaginibacter sp.]|uniref:SgcJ/EcaC family oxidoreductase n=1 Tax=Mucilaginibacter sp. TaxID=1882438 RepID=UPI0025DB6D11|nr:SgcJ/EcaC family oxidoreductase [Mucilaginibacter sp.]
MKKALTTIVCLLISGLIFAQDRTKDETAINKQVDAMIYSWNSHNYDDLKNYTTENTDWVNVVGMWWKGRKQSQYAHQVYHNTIFKTAVCEKTSVAIRFLTNDVAIVHLFWHFSDPHPVPLPDGKSPGPTDGLATIVYVKQNGKWLMDAAENVVIDKGAQPFDPVKQMPKD